MSKARQYIDAVIQICDSFEEDFQYYNQQLSRLDQLEQDMLHAIENVSFHGVQGFWLSKKVKIIREERRRVKNELIPLQALAGKIGEYKKGWLRAKGKLNSLDKGKNQYNNRYIMDPLDNDIEAFKEFVTGNRQAADVNIQDVAD